MSHRTLRTGLALLCAAAGAAAAAAFAAGPASAAAPATAKAAAACKVTGMTPDHKVAVGPKGKAVTFAIDTNCPAGSKIDWNYIAQYPGNVPNDATFPLYQWANYNVSNASHFQVNPEGKFTLGPGSAGDLLAGQPIKAGLSAFVDTGAAGHQSEPPIGGYDSTLTLLRATRVTGFMIDQTTVDKGDYIHFTSTTQRADWETGTWRTFFSHGDHVQFRADGATKWTAHAGDPLNDKASTSGDYRIRYAGDAWSGASNSKIIHVTVN